MDNEVDYSDQYNQYLSFSDLEVDPEWDDAWKGQDVAKVEELLYKYGCEVTHGWKVEVLNHRPRTSNIAVYGPRISFVARTDKEWEQYMTMEELIDKSTDRFMRAELKSMSRQSNFSGDLVDSHGKGEKV